MEKQLLSIFILDPHQWDESRPPKDAQLSHICGREWGFPYPGKPLLQGKINSSGRKRKCFKQSEPSPPARAPPHHFETLMAPLFDFIEES